MLQQDNASAYMNKRPDLQVLLEHSKLKQRVQLPHQMQDTPS